MKTINFNKLIPEGVLFSIKEIQSMGVIRSPMHRKNIFNRSITVVKIGAKNFIARDTLISYLEDNVIAATN